MKKYHPALWGKCLQKMSHSVSSKQTSSAGSYHHLCSDGGRCADIPHNLRWHVQHILHILHILHVLHLLCTCFICFIPCLCYSATIQRVQYKSYTVSLHKHGVIEIVEMNIYGTNCEGEMTCKSCIRGWDQRVPAQWAAMNPTVQHQQQQ